MIKVDKPHLIFCNNGNGAISIKSNEELITLSFWYYGEKPYKLSIKDRIKMIIKIIKTGTPYNNQINLSTSESLALIDGIKEHSNIEDTISHTYTDSTF